MAFHKITYHPTYRFATVHNYGCTFRCPICSYKLRSGADGAPGHAYPKPERFLSLRAIKETLCSVAPEKVYFMGGEPTVAKELPDLLDFARNALAATTYLGHTNGSRLPLANLNGANVGLKAWDESVHQAYTGRPKRPIFDNFAAAVDAGLEMKANVVYVPGLVDLDQVEAIAAWLAGLNADIPFHVMGYIPVPGQPYSRPTDEQMSEAVAACRRHLAHVAASHLTSQEALDLSARDDRFQVKQIA
ncbi:MAG: radical SAM protein [Planctomycetes bacterium]|nr:radical SAM protein [Planctomycetota bacterium]